MIDGSKYEGGDGVFINNGCAPNAEYTMDWYEWTDRTSAQIERRFTVLPIVALRYVRPLTDKITHAGRSRRGRRSLSPTAMTSKRANTRACR